MASLLVIIPCRVSAGFSVMGYLKASTIDFQLCVFIRYL